MLLRPRFNILFSDDDEPVTHFILRPKFRFKIYSIGSDVFILLLDYRYTKLFVFKFGKIIKICFYDPTVDLISQISTENDVMRRETIPDFKPSPCRTDM